MSAFLAGLCVGVWLAVIAVKLNAWAAKQEAERLTKEQQNG